LIGAGAVTVPVEITVRN